MVYQEIFDRVLKNLGIDKEDANTIVTIKQDIQDVLKEAFRTSETPIKNITPVAITTLDTSEIMPADFYLPLQVTFKTDTGKTMFSQEMTNEEFQRWQETTSVESIEDMLNVNDQGIGTTLTTAENLDYDGSIGYYFNLEFDSETNEHVTVLYWKPTVNGYLHVTYCYIPGLNGTLKGEKAIEINNMYSDVIVNGATAFELRRRFAKKGYFEKEIDLVANRDALRMFRGDYEQSLNRFIEYTKKGAETHIVRFHSFLDDPTMRL